MAQSKRLIHLRATQVEIAPLHTRSFIGFDAIFDRERRRERLIEHLKAVCEYLDLTGCHIGVLGTFLTSAHLTFNLDDPFAAEMLGNRKLFRGNAIGVDDHLRIPIAVTQVDEDQSAMIAIVPDPTGQNDFFANIFFAKFAAGLGVHAELVVKFAHRLNLSL